MPRVNKIDKCRKSPGFCGRCACKIETGEPYRFWKFRYGGKSIRCMKPGCNPKDSELTQSEFLGGLYGIRENIKDLAESIRNGTAGVRAALDDFEGMIEDLRGLGEEQNDKLNNMPEGLQNGPTGEMLATRAEECESKADELGSVLDDVRNTWEDASPEEAEQAAEDALEALRKAAPPGAVAPEPPEETEALKAAREEIASAICDNLDLSIE